MRSERRAELLKVLHSVARRPTVLRELNLAPTEKAERPLIRKRDIAAVVLAASTGGPKALTEFCAGLPADFPAPIALVQHNSSGFDLGFAQWLNTYTKLEVKLAEDGEMPRPGRIYVAPTDRHLLWKLTGFVLDDGASVNNQKPAADMLFFTAAKTFGGRLASVVFTGMGADGAEGTRAVKAAGGWTLAQDKETSFIYGMPMQAKETGCVDLVLPLGEIAGALCRAAGLKE
jgi:two-component system chemotaxis response regulator CheB